MSADPADYQGLSPAEQRDRFVDWVYGENPDPASLNSWPLATRQQVYESLVAPGTDGKRRVSAAALAFIARKLPLDPAFLAAEHDSEARLAAALRADPAIAKARANWQEMGTALRIAALSRAVEVACRHWGVESPAVIAVPEQTERGIVQVASYVTEDKTIFVNSEGDSYFESFGCSLNIMLHETRHHRQATQVADLAAGRIASDDPRRAQIALFAANLADDEAYLRGEFWGSEAYRAQPLEADAFAFAERMVGLYAKAEPDAKPKSAPARRSAPGARR